MSGGEASSSASPSGATASTVAPDVLVVRGARKRYGTRDALDGVDLTLRGGEVYALLGPNGAGKTTLIRAICGRVAIESGTVSLLGADPRCDLDARHRLGLVPQEIALYPFLTARENLEVLGRLAGVSRGEIGAAVERALDWTGLSDRAGDRAARLSGGMRRRLNIAAGTLHRPRLLLLDEPTVGVDPAARDDVHRMLRTLRDSGMAVLLTTHDLEQAEQLADRIGILVDGRIHREGTLEALVHESFGDDKELTLTLAEEAGEPGRAVLEGAGLAANADPVRWSGTWTGGLEALSGLDARMRSAGLSTTELRVRDPGLRGVFRKLIGRELEP
jgi:ABC-2 type transport system ATP-binding protein